MRITDEGLKTLSITREPEYNEALDAYLIYEWKGVQYFANLSQPSGLSENQIFIEVTEEQFLTISKEDTFAAKITNTKDLKELQAAHEAKEAISTKNNPKKENEVPSIPTKPATPLSPPLPVKTAQAKSVEKNSSLKKEEEKQIDPLEEENTGTSNLSILSQITSVYENALLLRYDQERNTLILDDIVGEITPKEGFQISLKHPSPFRIALQTLQPFHGLYSENEIVNQNLISCGINPQNLWITAFPLSDNNNLSGMLLGLSNKKTHAIKDLEIFEGVGFFAKNILKQSIKATKSDAA